MNDSTKDRLSANWKKLKGEVQKKWGKLTDDDVTAIKGERNKLVGKLQDRYGMAKAKAEKEVEDFNKSCNC